MISLGVGMSILPSWPMSIKAHVGRLLLVLALGVYTSSFTKDVACVPRLFPLSPASVTQCVHNYSMRVSNPNFSLAFSNNHLKYEIPSTHSTNLVEWAIALHGMYESAVYLSISILKQRDSYIVGCMQWDIWEITSYCLLYSHTFDNMEITFDPRTICSKQIYE